MTEQDSPPLEIETGAAPVFSVIWLHGLGADSHDFEQLPKMLDLPPGLPLRFILPDAPRRPITLNGGMVMRGWYDLTGMEAVKQEDAAGLAEAAATVESLVQKEVGRGVTRSHIVVGGFSQGGALALHFGLRCNEPLAGIVGLSTYLPLSAQLTSDSHAQARNIPIFLAHGLFDPVLALPLGEASHQALADGGFDVTWKTYAMQHNVSPEELTDLSTWLGERVWPAAGPA
ncbi:MAG TPA: hypothetical protein QGH18_05225 [Arenicellales bacterium]|nr:hypothetical protein [Arenicellales bacterium]